MWSVSFIYSYLIFLLFIFLGNYKPQQTSIKNRNNNNPPLFFSSSFEDKSAELFCILENFTELKWIKGEKFISESESGSDCGYSHLLQLRVL